VAQGSEEGFGKPYMVGWSDADSARLEAEAASGPDFTTVVSCNTHGILSLLSYLSGGSMDSVKAADFVVVRRSEDLGNHQRHVASNVVARHRGAFGTHHAEDANRVLALAGSDLRVSSSDITTPEQLMHSVRFRVEFKEDSARAAPGNPYVAETHCFDANRVFDMGRRYGFQGRLYNHAIVVSNDLLWSDDSVAGWAFVPQEGNTIISTIASMLETLSHPEREDILGKMRAELTRPFF
jgi:glyceraldehyde-3-phosphate dehydrogenase (NAD(P))